MFTALIAFLFVLGLLVLVHELGHFLTAKKFGIWSEEFGFGLPPRIFGVQTAKANGKRFWKFIAGSRELTPEDNKHGVVYSLNWIPFGGFVKIKGENGESDKAAKEDIKDSFVSKPIWQRIIVLAAGVVMNFLLAMVILIISMMIGIPQQISEDTDPKAIVSSHEIQIIEVSKGTPAQKADIKPGDIIASINNQAFVNTDDLTKFVSDKNGQELNYQIKRGQQTIDKKITPIILPSTNKGGIGVAVIDVGTTRFPWYLAIIKGIKGTFVLFWAIVLGFWGLLVSLFSGQSVAAEVSGPIGIATMAGQMADLGIVYLMNFTAILSLNLAFINILPIPALDGGRIIFLIIEKIRGKALPHEKEALVNNIFFYMLLGLIVFITYKDIAKLGCLSCKILSLFK
ncbi:MAG: RIP metalloprotease RseP [Patescibacteria group bacterium]|nr:RIP metalloprotease RseP [Patescibacteria group bacterium]